MIDLLLPRGTTRVVVYLNPISARFGAEKLNALCRETIGIEPDQRTAFIFTNKKRDTLLLYALDNNGDSVLMQKLDKGAFLLPAPDAAKKNHTVLKPSMLRKLFR